MPGYANTFIKPLAHSIDGSAIPRQFDYIRFVLSYHTINDLASLGAVEVFDSFFEAM